MDSFKKTLFIVIAAVLGLVLFVGCTTTRVDVGHIGLKVKLAGSDRGVQDIQIKTGWVFYNPLTEQIIEFPTSVQSIILTANPHEGGDPSDKDNEHAVDESISFSSVEGVNVGADIGFNFHIDPAQAPKLYMRFRQNDMRALAYSYMRNVIREGFNDVASKMPVQEIYGSGKTKLTSNVTTYCQKVLGKDGIIIDQLTINGALRLPQNVAEAINAAMTATQNAIQSENKVRQVTAEAEQAVAKAKGEAESARQKAQGEADALITRTKAEADAKVMSADAEAKANKTIQTSLSSSVIQYKAVTNWNGALPTYLGSSGPLPMIDVR